MYVRLYMYVHMWYISCRELTLTIYIYSTTNIFMEICSETIIGFAYEYTCQDREYTIRTMNTKQAWLVTNPILTPGCTQDPLSHFKHICDQVAQAMLTSSS